MSKLDEDKGIVYCNRVRIGNWYEATQLEEYKLNKFLEQMKKGDLMLARFRKMGENLNKPTELTQSAGSIAFGAKVCLLAPHVPASDPPVEGKNGLLLGGRISSNDISYSQQLEDGCACVGFPSLTPTEKTTFVISSADYCNREGEQVKYNQEFLLTLSSSLERKPLYVRYDPNPIPGLCGLYPLYLSEHAVTNTRWRVLPVQRNDITRFEQEGKPISVNADVIINHCATNVNLGFSHNWPMGFSGKVIPFLACHDLTMGSHDNREQHSDFIDTSETKCPYPKKSQRCICCPLMKTCLDIYGKETPTNIWQVYTPIPS